MLEKWMIGGEIDLAMHAQALRLGFHALELNAVLGFVELDAVERAEKIKMPPSAAEFAVGRQLQADLFLLLNDLIDLPVLDFLQLRSRHLAPLAFRPRLFQRRGAQQAADLVGAIRRLCSFHCCPSTLVCASL